MLITVRLGKEEVEKALLEYVESFGHVETQTGDSINLCMYDRDGTECTVGYVELEIER